MNGQNSVLSSGQKVPHKLHGLTIGALRFMDIYDGEVIYHFYSTRELVKFPWLMYARELQACQMDTSIDDLPNAQPGNKGCKKMHQWVELCGKFLGRVICTSEY